MSKFESFEWVKIPSDLSRENLVMVVAKTTKTTIHPEDEEGYNIRIFKPEELREAARSLAQRPVGICHGPVIEGAFTVDANWNEKEQCVEALLYLPTYWMNRVRNKEIKKVSVEFTWRNENRTDKGVEFEGFVFNRVDLLAGMNPGDSDTMLQPVLMEGKRGLMEGIIQQDIIQDSIDNPSLSFFKEACEAADNFMKTLGEPFAGFKNFDACTAWVRKNRPDVTNPDAYCGAIKAKAEPKKESTELREGFEIVKRVEVPKEEAVYEPPEAGSLPEHGKKILAAAYASCRADKEHSPYGDKERCSKVAWGAVKNAGYIKEDDKWVKKEGEGCTPEKILSLPEFEPQPTELVPTPQDMPSDVTVNPDNPKEPFKQIPEQPVSPMASEPSPMTPNPIPQQQEPVGVTSIGAVSDKDTGGPLGRKSEPDNPDKNLSMPPATASLGPHDSGIGASNMADELKKKEQLGDDKVKIGKQPEVGIGTPLVEAPVPKTDEERAKIHFNISDEEWNKLTIEQKNDYIKKLPVRGSGLKESKKELVKKEESKPVDKSVVPPLPSTPTSTKEPDKLIEPSKPDDKENRIKELEGAVSRLQENVRNIEANKDKAIKEATEKTKKELIDKIKKALPSEEVVSNFNRGGKVLANDIRKVIYEATKDDR
jgi:cation transport regulator ChaB